MMNFAPSESTASSARRVALPAFVSSSRVMYLIVLPWTFIPRSSSASFMPRSRTGPTSEKAPVNDQRPSMTTSFGCARSMAGKPTPSAAAALPSFTTSRRVSLLMSILRAPVGSIFSGDDLSLEPRVHEPVAQPVAVVVLEPLHGWLVRDVLGLPRQVHVIGFVDEIALDVVDDLATTLGIHLASLGDQELVQLGISDVAPIRRQFGEMDAVEPVVDLRIRGDRGDGHLLELPERRRRDPLAVLLRLQLDGDPDPTEVVDGEVVEAAPGRAEARPVVSRRREALRVAGFGQELLRLGQIVADQVLGLGRVHLREVELPFLQRTGYGPGIETAFAIEERVVPRLALEDEPHALIVGLQHEGAGPDDRLRPVEVAELLLQLPRQDRRVRRVGEVIQERRVGLLERDAHGVAIDGVDRQHRVQTRAKRRFGHETLE